MNTPEELLYTKEHEWIKPEGDLLVTGITDFAQNMLTDIVFVELPEVGTGVEKGQPFMVVESVKSVSDVFAIAAGEVAEINSALADNPALINTSPYQDGWLAKIKPKNPFNPSQFLSAADYTKFCQESDNQ